MNTSTAPRQAPRGAARRRTSTSLRRSTGVRGRARLGVVTLAVLVVLAVGLVRAPDSGAAIPEPTATAQAALLGACVALGPVHDPVTEATTLGDLMSGLEGGCACGKVQYRLTSSPMFVHCCHCLNCQRQTGSAFALNLLIEATQVELLGATPVPVPVP